MTKHFLRSISWSVLKHKSCDYVLCPT